MKLERVVRLRINIHTDNLESGSMKPHTGAACAAKQIESAQLFSFNHNNAP